MNAEEIILCNDIKLLKKLSLIKTAKSELIIFLTELENIAGCLEEPSERSDYINELIGYIFPMDEGVLGGEDISEILKIATAYKKYLTSTLNYFEYEVKYVIKMEKETKELIRNLSKIILM